MVAPGPGGVAGRRARTAAISPRAEAGDIGEHVRGVGEQGQAGQDGPDHLDDEDGQRDAQHGGEFAAVVGQGCPVAVAVVAHDAV